MKKSSTINSSLRKLVLASLAAGPVALVPTLRALPVLPDTSSANLTAGSGVTTNVAGTTLNINIAGSAKTFTILNWVDFGGGSSPIAASSTVQYYQPTADSAVLNRITGSNTTTIGGTLGSNGLICILNPNGIVISSGATINAAGFVASAVNDTDWSNFSTSGTLSMTGGNAGNVTDSGATITTVGSSGNVVLAGGTMNVAGTINGNLQVKTVWTGGVVNLSAAGGGMNNLTVTGDLKVNSNGDAIDLGSGGGTTTVSGNTTIDSTGTLAYGNVTTTAGGSLVANGAAKTVSINTGGSSYTNANATVNGDISNLTLTNVNVANVTTTNAATATTVNAGTTGAATITSAGALTVGTSTIGGVLTATASSGDLSLGAITAKGNVVATSTLGNITSSGTVAVTNGNSVTLDAAAAKAVTYVGSGNITIAGATGTTISITNAGNVSSGAITGGPTSVTVKATGGTVTTGNIDVTTAGSVTLSGDNGVSTGTINAKNATVTASAGTATLGAISLDGVAGSLTISAQNSIALPAITLAPTVTVTSTGGDITESGTITNGVGGTVAGSFNAAGAITLTNANAFSSVKLVNSNAAKAVSLTNSASVVVANGTNTMGATTVTTTAGDINLGAAAADTLSFGALTLNAAGNINATTAKSITATSTSLQAGGNATLNAASNTFSLGTITTAGGGVTGSLTLSESSGINLGNITAGSLAITSGTSIWTSGVLTSAGAASFDLSAAGDITLNTKNMLTGAVTIGAGGKVGNATVMNDAALSIAGATGTTSVTLTTASTGENITQTGVIKAPTLTVNTTGTSTTTLNSANVLSTVTLGTASTGAVGITNSGGTLTVNGNTSGALTVNETGGDISFGATSKNQAVTLNNNAAGAITINGAITGAGAQGLSAMTSNGAIYIGSFYSESGGLTANTANTAAKTITDVANSRANIFGDINLKTAGGVVSLTNNAPSGLSTSTLTASRFGGYTIDTTNGGAVAAGADITTMEGGTVRIVNVNAGTGGNVNISATNSDAEFASNPSNIVSTAGAGATTLKGKTISLNARNSVILNDPGQTVISNGTLFAVANTNASLATSIVTLGDNTAGAAISATGVVDAIASGDVTINSTGALKLGGGNSVTGDFYAGGKLTVNAGGNITQTTDRLRAKSDVTINAGANSIDLTTGTDNEFGGMSLTGSTVSTTENGTTRLAAVNATNLNVTTTGGGDIIDTSGQNIVVGALGVATLTPGGSVNLTNSSGNQITGLKVTATGAGQNVSINSTTAMVVQNSTNIGGNLTLKDTFAGASAIADQSTGAGYTVGGTATYLATDAAGGINITNPNDSFAKLRFTAGSNGAMIYQNNSMVLEPGSTTTGGGNVTLRSINGTISNDSTATGSNSFAGTVTLQAMQNVTITNEWFVAGTLSVTTSSGMIVDLSGLSQSVDLQGTPKYKIVGGTLKAGTPGS